MTKNPKLRRILLALLISIVLNGVLISSGPLTEHHPASAIARALDLLSRPAGAFTEWLVPAGHDAVHILGAVAVSAMSSIVFYALLAWVLLAARARQGKRRTDSPPPATTTH